jgi:hypothetical protein
MSGRIVTTQAEFNAAAADKAVDWIEIRSPRGVWIEVRAYGSATVTAYGSATVRAYGSATVRAYDSATVRAYGSATVTAYDSATVTAYGSATVRAYDSATVTAYGSATVRAYGSATVTASPKVAVHLHSGYAKVTGGVLIDHTADLSNAADWCEYHGVKVTKAGVATLYKAVDDAWTTPRGFDYSPGSKPKAPDWSADNSCGGGLHFSPSPAQALAYHAAATRFVAVGVKVADLRPILDGGGPAKAKAPAVVRACRPVDIDGNEVRP